MKYLRQIEILLHCYIILLSLVAKVAMTAELPTKSDHFESDSDSDEEIFVKPELFSMTEANLCSILIDRSNLPASESNETANFYAKTSIFGRENEPFAPFIEEHILSEFEILTSNENVHEIQQAIVYEFCIRKANEGIF